MQIPNIRLHGMCWFETLFRWNIDKKKKNMHKWLELISLQQALTILLCSTSSVKVWQSRGEQYLESNYQISKFQFYIYKNTRKHEWFFPNIFPPKVNWTSWTDVKYFLVTTLLKFCEICGKTWESLTEHWEHLFSQLIKL